jgi:hypothetical protein
MSLTPRDSRSTVARNADGVRFEEGLEDLHGWTLPGSMTVTQGYDVRWLGPGLEHRLRNYDY